MDKEWWEHKKQDIADLRIIRRKQKQQNKKREVKSELFTKSKV